MEVEARCPQRLISVRMTRMITAPMVALMMSRTQPTPRLTPSCGSSQLASSAPMMPMTILPISPKPAHDQPGKPGDAPMISAAMCP
jgi:hypothetical protein